MSKLINDCIAEILYELIVIQKFSYEKAASIIHVSQSTAYKYCQSHGWNNGRTKHKKTIG